MTSSPLNNLHKAFALALTDGDYVGLSKNDPKTLQHDHKKNIRLAEVFKHAQHEIETTLKKKPLAIDQEITTLKKLEKDGNDIYKRYEKSTKTWSRWFLKGLATYTPNFLKKILPSCFSNNMKKAEQETCHEFKKYEALVKEKITELSNQKNRRAKEVSEPEDKPVPGIAGRPTPPANPTQSKTPAKTGPSKTPAPLPPSTKPFPPNSNGKKDAAKEKHIKELREKHLKYFTKPKLETIHEDEDPALQASLFDSLNKKRAKSEENPKQAEAAKPVTPKKPDISLQAKEVEKEKEVAKAKEKATEKKLEIIRCRVESIQKFNQRPLSLLKFRKDLEKMVDAIQSMIKIDAKNYQQALEKLGINDKALAALTTPELIKALQEKNDAKTCELLEPTGWQPFFKEAQEQKGFIKFGFSKIAKGIVLTDENDKKVKESLLQNYRGQIKVILGSNQSLGDIENLMQFLEKHPSCLPYSIVINIKEGEPLTAKLFQSLMKFKDCTAEIQILGLKEINFDELGISGEEEYQFVQHLDSFQIPQLANLIFSKLPKRDWNAQDFSKILALLPTMELLEECYSHCPDYQNIDIPANLIAINKFDLKNFSIDQITHLLSRFSSLISLDFNGLTTANPQLITDTQLAAWLNLPALQSLQNLKLEECPSLTTDILPLLAKMPRLAKASLPDLPKGKIALEKLPKLSNPFKIKMLYAHVKATQSIASSLYTGPNHLASIFQIPLARAGVENVFNPNQIRIGPMNVAYWLHNSDYKALKPKNNNIAVVIADSNAALNDGNLVEFMQKFPKAQKLSLYQCPNVTEEGIIALLKACPNIKKLDLTGCLHITENFFLNDGNFDLLNKLQEIILTGTGISSGVVKTFAETMQKGKIQFEEANLKISDQDLTDEDSLEKILNGKNLTQLKRIDLENCTKLTNNMLGKLLDRLNTDDKILSTNGQLIDNPQRLNLAVLNLKGCSQISDEAFYAASESKDEKKREPQEPKAKTSIQIKYLGTLDRLVFDGTKISMVLQEKYSKITFQANDEPFKITINPDLQLQGCISYHSGKNMETLGEEEKQLLKHATAKYLHNRTVVELFCKENELTEDVLVQTVDPQSEEFCDITLYFKANDKADPTTFKTQRDFLYYQSPFFLESFRPGGKLYKQPDFTLLNQHAHPKAAQATMDLINEKSCINDLYWETAADVAELVGPNHCKLAPFFYKSLLAKIYSEFENNPLLLVDVVEGQKKKLLADQMLFRATMLKDEEGKKKYEQILLEKLKTVNPSDKITFQKFANLAHTHALTALQAELTKALINHHKNAQQLDNDKKTAQLLKDLAKKK